jgi:hypothetical protein
VSNVPDGTDNASSISPHLNGRVWNVGFAFLLHVFSRMLSNSGCIHEKSLFGAWPRKYVWSHIWPKRHLRFHLLVELARNIIEGPGAGGESNPTVKCVT